MEAIEDWDIEGALEKCREANAALVAFDITPLGAVLLVGSSREEDLVPIYLDEFSSDSIDQITWRSHRAESTPLSWGDVFPIRNERWPKWSEHQPRILARLGQWLWPKLDRFLQEENIDRVILIPQGELFLYPLHATPFTPLHRDSDRPIYPLERYTIVYAPSLRVYDQLTDATEVRLKGKQALFVEDPDGNLGFSFAGQGSLSDQLQKRELTPVVLHGSDVTADNLLEHMKKATLTHYYGHGYSDWLHPESSGLKMYSPGEKMNLLTMGEISQTLSASQAELVVLSACETGITDVLHSQWREQFVGLPAGFLRAGAKIVWWGVSGGFQTRRPAFFSVVSIKSFFPVRKGCVRQRPCVRLSCGCSEPPQMRSRKQQGFT